MLEGINQGKLSVGQDTAMGLMQANESRINYIETSITHILEVLEGQPKDVAMSVGPMPPGAGIDGVISILRHQNSRLLDIDAKLERVKNLLGPL